MRELNEREAAAGADIDNGDAAAEPDGVQELQAERGRPQGEIVVDESGTRHDQKFLTMALPQRLPASIRRPTPIYHERMPIDIAALLFVRKKQDGR